MQTKPFEITKAHILAILIGLTVTFAVLSTVKTPVIDQAAAQRFFDLFGGMTIPVLVDYLKQPVARFRSWLAWA